jgi:hypothetical protein
MDNSKRSFILIAYGAALGCGAMIIWPFTPFRSTTKDWVDVATAIGTCGAVVVALWLGLRQEALRREDAELKAQMIGTHLAPRLAVVLDAAVRTHEALFGEADAVGDTGRCFAAYGVCGPLTSEIPPEQLAALTPLPQSAAFRLARAMALLNNVAAGITQKLEANGRLGVINPRGLNEAFASWRWQLDDGMALLRTSLKELVAVSEELGLRNRPVP